jgi:hypothetical protein
MKWPAVIVEELLQALEVDAVRDGHVTTRLFFCVTFRLGTSSHLFMGNSVRSPDEGRDHATLYLPACSE